MSKRFEPAHADIYMDTWEETIFPKCSKLPLHYFRYLDNIWSHTEDEFQEVLETLNSHHPPPLGSNQ